MFRHLVVVAKNGLASLPSQCGLLNLNGTIPRHNPINAITMGNIIRDAGLTGVHFKQLLPCKWLSSMAPIVTLQPTKKLKPQMLRG